MAERIRTDYFKLHAMPKEDTMERIRISIKAQMVSDESVSVFSKKRTPDNGFVSGIRFCYLLWDGEYL
ncbi:MULTISPECIES: hypothetical protein [Clostridium]|uniref:hypothetical protein n=1 Tax=Clostridium TaxID=1485 RepID=UPI00024BACAE|nr:hypothetical protein [Clostridium sporogenes]EHN15123.1 hypothetical protein IYC_09584 [Clostridium sporogenes PA 3679]MBA4509000.1 hypothetical protein [Clostridium sporogenes]MCW6088509.1 hypothetical protein [Clostridium sporogenes]MCW6088734.1 hypothetical protein [Clostridium sporogenes]MCW6105207.1 hypothetical protein [Clostridium sporogenes]